MIQYMVSFQSFIIFVFSPTIPYPDPTCNTFEANGEMRTRERTSACAIHAAFVVSTLSRTVASPGRQPRRLRENVCTPKREQNWRTPVCALIGLEALRKTCGSFTAWGMSSRHVACIQSCLRWDCCPCLVSRLRVTSTTSTSACAQGHEKQVAIFSQLPFAAAEPSHWVSCQHQLNLEFAGAKKRYARGPPYGGRCVQAAVSDVEELLEAVLGAF